MKTCNKCKINAPFECFSKDKHKKDGLATICKSCKSASDKIYRELNKERIRENKKRWECANRDHCNVKSREAKRRAIKLNATPTWANIRLIEEIYEACPEGHHVDHIAPLQGRNVCGLHVEYNLQHLLAIDNFVKSNRF